MSDYTVEDFARANRATRGELDVASRVDPGGGAQWRYVLSGGTSGWLSDEDMTAEGWTPVVESRITLDDLADAWAAAEVADECREGDVLIIRDDEDNYLVRRMGDGYDLDSTARILSRAPKREPWAELADVLADMGHLSPTGHAKALYERGVRVTGDE